MMFCTHFHQVTRMSKSSNEQGIISMQDTNPLTTKWAALYTTHNTTQPTLQTASITAVHKFHNFEKARRTLQHNTERAIKAALRNWAHKENKRSATTLLCHRSKHQWAVMTKISKKTSQTCSAFQTTMQITEAPCRRSRKVTVIKSSHETPPTSLPRLKHKTSMAKNSSSVQSSKGQRVPETWCTHPVQSNLEALAPPKDVTIAIQVALTSKVSALLVIMITAKCIRCSINSVLATYSQQRQIWLDHNSLVPSQRPTWLERATQWA